MASENSHVERRAQAFSKKLHAMPVGIEVKIQDFASSCGFFLRHAGSDDSSGKGKEKITERQLDYALSHLKEELQPKEIVRSRDMISLRYIAQTAYDRRAIRSSKTKAALGRALWAYLYPNLFTKSPPVFEAFEAPAIKEKLATLRRRNQLFFAADAGTTTLHAIKALLELKETPIKISIDPSNTSVEDAIDNERFVEPVLLTNSLPIINAVGESETHRNSFIVEVIGGTHRVNRNCNTGALADLWLRVCCAQGLIGILDLVIIGASGIFLPHGDDATSGTAACDDPQEAGLKAKLLEMASGDSFGHPGGIRTLIFHAAKVGFPEARCRFAALSSAGVDLVVVDKGLKGDPVCRQKVQELVNFLRRKHITCLLVDSVD